MSEAGEAEIKRRLERVEAALFGFNGDNGLYGDMKDMRAENARRWDAHDEKWQSLYRLLAVTALTVLGSGLGVVVTLISTSR